MNLPLITAELVGFYIWPSTLGSVLLALALAFAAIFKKLLLSPAPPPLLLELYWRYELLLIRLCPAAA